MSRLVISVLGIEVFAITTGTAEPTEQADGAPDYLSTAQGFGFAADVRYELAPGGDT